MHELHILGGIILYRHHIGFHSKLSKILVTQRLIGEPHWHHPTRLRRFESAPELFQADIIERLRKIHVKLLLLLLLLHDELVVLLLQMLGL